MKTLLIATTRKEKIKEIKQLAQQLKFKIKTLKDLKLKFKEPLETGKTYKENAIIKAKYYGKKTKLLTLADDSGLEVFALKGKLGINSKRFALGSDKNRNRKLLNLMKNIPEGKRKARFVSILALFNPKNNSVKITEGYCYGNIGNISKGKFGFGYDPIFIVNKMNKSFAQLTLTQKNLISHRSQSLKKMLKYLHNIN